MDTSDIILVRKVHLYFKKAGLTLCLAESCTGGLISHLLTGLPGASGFLDSAVVSYSIDSKIKLLGVSKTLLKRYGVVSEETARAMASALRKKRKTDISLSTTGNLGPAALESRQVGLVYIAVASAKETISMGRVFEGDREAIKHQASMAAISLLNKAVRKWA